MSSLLNLCEKYFGSRNLYEVLKISKDSDEKQVRKAYHKLSLQVHPDRVEDNKKEEATEKFKVLGTIHSILSDTQKKALYDETGEIDEEGDGFWNQNWQEYWKLLFKEITIEDIANYEKNYKGSELELKDLKRAYVDGKGDMDFILGAVPFTNTEEEGRLKEILQGLIDSNEVPEFKEFTEESPEKRARRKRRYDREAQETIIIAERQRKRERRSSLNRAVVTKKNNIGLTRERAFNIALLRRLETRISKKKKPQNTSAMKDNHMN